MGYKKTFCINSTLQDLGNFIATTKLKNSFSLVKRNTRAAKAAISRFYINSWLTNPDKFPQVVAWFKGITTHFQVIYSFIQQSIISVVASAVTIAIAVI